VTATVEIDTLVLAPMGTNCYVLRSGGQCWVVDVAPGAGPLIDHLRDVGAAGGKILLTHGHADHMGGVARLLAEMPEFQLCCPEGDLNMLEDPTENLSAMLGVPMTAGPVGEVIRPGEVLQLGAGRWQVLDTSGHTPGGVSFYSPQARVVLSGDALFAGGIGRCDFPHSNGADLMRNIRENLLSLPDETRLLSGHGPESTIGIERETNPFLIGA